MVGSDIHDLVDKDSLESGTLSKETTQRFLTLQSSEHRKDRL
jgi:hypothetical protein